MVGFLKYGYLLGLFMSIWKTKINFKQKLCNIFVGIAKVLIKFFVILSLGFYVIMGVGSLFNVVSKEINKIRDVSYLNVVIEDAKFGGRSKDIDWWIDQRPNSELEQIIEIVKPHVSYIDPLLFFKLSFRLLEEDKEEEAVFWYLLARYRFRYDMLRCGAGESVVKIDNFIEVLGLSQIKYMINLIDKDVKRTKNIIKKVLDFDEKHPAENSMKYACHMVGLLEESATPVQEGRWASIRDALRLSAKEFVNSK